MPGKIMPIQSIVMPRYFFFSVLIKFNASFLAVYFNPKSSTTKLNKVSRVACFKRPGVKPAQV